MPPSLTETFGHLANSAMLARHWAWTSSFLPEGDLSCAAKIYEAMAGESGDLAKGGYGRTWPEVAKEAVIEVGADLAEEAL